MAKTFGWRSIAPVVNATFVFIFTGEIALSLGAGASEAVSKLFLYFLHEPLWERVGGRQGQPSQLVIVPDSMQQVATRQA